MYIGLHVKYPLFLSDFNETWIFSTDFPKMQISNYMKSVSGSGVRTDMTKLTVASRNLKNAPHLHRPSFLPRHFLQGRIWRQHITPKRRHPLHGVINHSLYSMNFERHVQLKCRTQSYWSPKSATIWWRVVERVVPDLTKDRSACVFRVKQSKNDLLDSLTQRRMWTWTFSYTAVLTSNVVLYDYLRTSLIWWSLVYIQLSNIRRHFLTKFLALFYS